jgi:hypothetical protein
MGWGSKCFSLHHMSWFFKPYLICHCCCVVVGCVWGGAQAGCKTSTPAQMIYEMLCCCWHSVHCCCCLQAFSKDGKLLSLLKTLISQHGSLADTPASQLSPEQVQQLQQVCL